MLPQHRNEQFVISPAEGMKKGLAAAHRKSL
jgi:hypothetical protein